MTTRYRLAGALLLTLAASASSYAADTKTLFERLGGKDALTAVVNELWSVVSTDTRINARFAHTKPEAFGGQLVAFLCEASGGPCKYQGKDMKSAHVGMQLTESDFTALAQDTAKVLDKFKVPATEKNEVLALLGSLKGDVINH